MTWSAALRFWRDGHAISAPVGSYRPNAFGLHDLHGNVAEVCADSVVDPRAEPRAGDGQRLQHDERLISVRGGSFADPAERARSGGRNAMPQHARMAQVGVRLARAVH